MYDTEREVFYEDIAKINYRSMPDFDLLVGGPCCQSFSVAGRRRAFEDDRGNLFFNYIKILEVKRPKYFIAENVPNLLGISQGECYRIILFDDLRTFGNLILIKKQEVLIVVFVNAYLTDEEKKLLRRQKYLIQDGEYLNIC